jgi:hypothetical protein
MTFARAVDIRHGPLCDLRGSVLERHFTLGLNGLPVMERSVPLWSRTAAIIQAEPCGSREQPPSRTEEVCRS